MSGARYLLAIGLIAAGYPGATPGADTPNPATQLRALIADEWAARLADDPLFATQSGVRDYDDRLPPVSPADHARRAAQDLAFSRRLAAIDRSALSRDDRVNHDLFAFMLQHRIALAPFRAWRIPLTSDEGFHVDTMRMGSGLTMSGIRDYERYIARLRAIPAYFAQQIANMKIGVREGFTLPAAVMPGIVKVAEGQQYATAEESPFFEPFTHFPESIAPADRERLTARGRAAIEQDVIPAYRTLLAFFRDEYAPAARRTIGASALPKGEAYYAALVRFYTNLDVTPRQVHDTGLAEVARIGREMREVIARTGFKGDFAAFLHYLRTDPKFYAQTPHELLAEASFIAKQADGKLPGFFGRLPRQPYGVEPVPAELAPNYTGGRYVPAPIGGTHGGEYWVNTYALDKRPLYVLTALTLHEAVPGHHLQGALARELEDVPPFRLDFYPHAFGEGWGLYSEKLGIEMGMYRTPYDDFGRLTYEMWRACRLVVDTGMHAFGWTREQALEYLGSRTALSEHEVRTEIDRYISWPGQALAYKMGELEILRLRAKAERELGARFDLRAFHDAVLGNGGVPLPVLATRIDEYIASRRTTAP